MNRPRHEMLMVDELGLRMEHNKKVRDVTAEYARASKASGDFNPGEQPDIRELMKAAFIHGYAQALLDSQSDALSEQGTPKC